jgi:hypothetical protein
MEASDIGGVWFTSLKAVHIFGLVDSTSRLYPVSGFNVRYCAILAFNANDLQIEKRTV